jgi:hypothetical protein
MIRIVFNVDISLSESTSQIKELGQTTPWKGLNDQCDDGGTWRQKVAAGTTNLAIGLNGITDGLFLAVKTTKEITLKRNSTADTGWPIRPLGVGATEGVFICSTDGLTSLYVTNSGTEAAEITFAVAGMIT